MYVTGLASERFNAHILAVEKPGSGILKSSKYDQTTSNEDASLVYDYAKNCLGLSEKDIVLYGKG